MVHGHGHDPDEMQTFQLLRNGGDELCEVYGWSLNLKAVFSDRYR